MTALRREKHIQGKTHSSSSGVRTWDACKTGEAVRRSTKASRPLICRKRKHTNAIAHAASRPTYVSAKGDTIIFKTVAFSSRWSSFQLSRLTCPLNIALVVALVSEESHVFASFIACLMALALVYFAL